MSSFQHTSSRDSFETISQTLSLPLLPSNGPDTDSSSSVTTNRLADVIATPTNGDYLAPANFRPLPAPVSFRPVRDSHLRGARLLTADAPPACRASSGLGQFLLGMKLETVVPEDLRSPDDIETTPLCLATITRVQNNLLWLLPDLPQTRLSFRQQSCDDLSYSTHGQQHSPLLVSIHSTKIFPFGWSELVNHPLILPSGYEEIDYHTQAPINADCKKVFLPQVSGGPTNVTPPRANRRSGDSDTLISDGDDRNRSFSSTENDIIASYFHRGPVRRPHSHFSRMEYGRTSRFEGSGTKEDEAKAIESSTASSTSSDSARSRQRRSTSNMRKLQHYQQPPFLLENELKSNYTEDGLKPLEESKYFHLSMGRGYDDTEPPVDLEISRLRQATPVVDQESITAHRYAVASCLSGYLALKEEEEHCPPIFINSRCHLGPFLCKVNFIVCSTEVRLFSM
ncbi:unnamed protein product [Protopolystoma xenopodis]|uniref:Uncharacterized protein n=1 Tax=Protopolystoma xenopodis TaxID=117903 RepID=A0A3S5CJY4_9PLAT|nr:unnamed protein product [Protopolystoma xenopodis]